MTETLTFTAEFKTESGKGINSSLRKQLKIPAMIYGGRDGNIMLTLDQKSFLLEYQKGNIQSKLVTLSLDSKKYTVIPREIQLHPVTDMPLHIDFQQLEKDKETKVNVHIRIINEDKCLGLKKGGNLNVAHRMIAVYSYPDSIPAHIDIDVAGLEIGRSIHADQITLPEGVRFVDKTNPSLVSVGGRKAKEDDLQDQGGENTATEGAGS